MKAIVPSMLTTKAVNYRAVFSLVVVLALLLMSPTAAHASPFGAPEAAPVTGVAGWILARQAMFYRALSGTLLAAKSDGSALWALMAIAFVYGIFHAAGPGHGKAVISSYLLANDETWRRGVALSFASALVQSITAVLIVGFAAALLGATAKMMGDAVRAIEIVSYSLIVLLGARMLWVKGVSFSRAVSSLGARCAGAGVEYPRPDDVVRSGGIAFQKKFQSTLSGCGLDHSGLFKCEGCDHGDGHTHDDDCVDHAHDHDLDVLPWGHAHGPEPRDLRGPGGWRRGLSAIMAVGLRPCSGAIIVLVFALSQGLFWAGVASTFVMGLGTAMTVAAIATLAVGAKAFARRFAADGVGYGGVLVRGLEVGAAALVLTFGVLLLAGYMASERLVGF